MDEALKTVDLLIIGGGINGVGIANDAVGRGLSVMLVEQNDLASATSSASSKLIHGGLRYLEYGEFRLVREALQEREVLRNIAPHLITPLHFIMPQDASLRSPWIIRTGLFLYDLLASNSTLPKTKSLQLIHSPFGIPLKKTFTKGFSYYDCKVDDARLVIANALSAAEKGAEILTRTQFISAHRHEKHWLATLRKADGLTQQIQSRCIINVAGPWVAEVQSQLVPNHKIKIRRVKGSHIVVPKLYAGEQAYILQNEDKRVTFIIPFQHDFTLIGTTDIDYANNPAEVAITSDEIAYLCHCANRYLIKPIRADDVIHAWSGLRTLQEEEGSSAASLSRDYHIVLDEQESHAPLLTVIGGKVTTYRRLAEHALQLITPFFNTMKPQWTAQIPLAGGDIVSLAEFSQELIDHYPILDPTLLKRYAHTYGSHTIQLLDHIHTMDELGIHFGAGLFQREVEYLMAKEWAQTTDDILWRRTKLGMRFSPEGTSQLQHWLEQAH